MALNGRGKLVDGQFDPLDELAAASVQHQDFSSFIVQVISGIKLATDNQVLLGKMHCFVDSKSRERQLPVKDGFGNHLSLHSVDSQLMVSTVTQQQVGAFHSLEQDNFKILQAEHAHSHSLVHALGVQVQDLRFLGADDHVSDLFPLHLALAFHLHVRVVLEVHVFVLPDAVDVSAELLHAGQADVVDGGAQLIGVLLLQRFQDLLVQHELEQETVRERN